jgi:hypothetical protein
MRAPWASLFSSSRICAALSVLHDQLEGEKGETHLRKLEERCLWHHRHPDVMLAVVERQKSWTLLKSKTYLALYAGPPTEAHHTFT